MRRHLVIKNVAIPLVLDDRFVPPDLLEGLEYYHSWRIYAGSEWSFQGYLCYILKEIDRCQPNGYTAGIAFSELIDYIGWEGWYRLMRSGNKSYDG